jgi:hypothetical protein
VFFISSAGSAELLEQMTVILSLTKLLMPLGHIFKVDHFDILEHLGKAHQTVTVQLLSFLESG